MTLKEWLVRFRSFWMFPFIAILLLYATFSAEPRRRYGDLLWLFPLGVLIWTLLEYGLHRFIFHIQVAIRNQRIRDLINASHLGHHAAPRDPTKLLVHPSYGMVISAVLLGIIYLVAGSLSAAAGVLSGVWAGFLHYEAVHYRVHFNLSNSGLIVRRRRLHFYHHFTNNKRCFGVTSPLWDYVFRTALPRQPR
jgi:4-hydroxysphinganine ceramide fatty acyl 2-hydroxylase